jgi:hypothetical protein
MKKQFCILSLFCISIVAFGQQKKPLIDIFYEALSKTSTDTVGSATKFYELSLNNYENEIIDPAAIIRKYPDAKKFLVNDSIFPIKCYVEINGLLEDLSKEDPRITLRNFKFKKEFQFNIKIYSDLADEVYNASDLTFENIEADARLMIWFNNFDTTFKNNTINNLWIGNESVVSPNITISENKIDLLQIWASKPRNVAILNNELGIVEINEAEVKKFDIIDNTFRLPEIATEARQWFTILRDLSLYSNLKDSTKTNFWRKVKGDFLLALVSEDRTINNLTISGNTFYDEGSSSPVLLAQKSSKMTVTDNTFESPLILAPIVNASFDLDDNQFSTVSMGVSMPSTPQNFVNVSWKDLKGKLVWQPLISSIPYRAITDEELSDTKNFFGLLGSYSRLLEVYKNYGNLDAANDVFLDMKEIHMRRYKYLYKTDGGTTNFFQLNLNRLLSIYTKHGTDPAQAMTASLWIIIFFSFIYFFFPSDWDASSKSKLIANFRAFIEKNEKGYFRPLFSLIKGLVSSFFNAITLSVNSFVTLGFGTIPTKGLAKYICIFQGFLGWFLLSIFIVALINQILI